MAAVAQVARANVARPFSGSIATVMAAHAIARNPLMIECRGSPRTGGMALVAFQGGRNVRGRLLAQMTRRTISHHLSVINDRAPVRAGSVARLAQRRAVNVLRCLAARVRAVVATHAGVSDSLMVEEGRTPGIGVMAHHAICRCRNVSRRFSGSLRAVVTPHAIVGESRVVKCRDDLPCRRDVAAAARQCCGRVLRSLAARIGAIVASCALSVRCRVIHPRRFQETCGH